MDLGSAVVVGLVLTGLVALARSLIEGPTNKDRLTVVVCLALGIGTVLLVGASDFASEQVLLDKPLDTLNVWSQILLGVLLAGVASTLWQAVKAVSNVGENQPKTPQALAGMGVVQQGATPQQP